MSQLTQDIFGNQLYKVGKKSDISKQVFTPVNIVNDMINLIPDEMFKPESTFIDIYCKQGIFLKQIYEKLDKALQKIDNFKDEKIRRNHILSNQLYGLTMDDSGSLLLCNKVLYGDAFADGNISYLESTDGYDGIVNRLSSTEVKEKIERMFNREGLGFDVVVGNPPYNRGGTSIS